METEIYREYRMRIRAAAVEWRLEHSKEYNAWTIETVKHLAFVNGAGLAGAAAIYASTDAAKKIVGPFGLPVAMIFAIGLVFAVLDMYLNSLGALARIRELDGRLKVWDGHPGPKQREADQLLRDAKAGKWLFRFAGYAGWASATLFAIGAYPFVFLRF